MDITPKQFEAILKQVLADELPKHLQPLKKDIANLSGDVAELSATLRSYLHQEWNVHIRAAHPGIEKRLTRLERQAGLKPA